MELSYISVSIPTVRIQNCALRFRTCPHIPTRRLQSRFSHASVGLQWEHQLRVWNGCAEKNGQSLFQCAALRVLTSMILAGILANYTLLPEFALLRTVPANFPLFHHVGTRYTRIPTVTTTVIIHSALVQQSILLIHSPLSDLEDTAVSLAAACLTSVTAARFA